MLPDKHKRKKRPTFKLESSNVRTMTSGMDRENINDARKTAIIYNELHLIKLPINLNQNNNHIEKIIKL